MTKNEAKKLCILKWEYIVNNDGSDVGLIYKHPELDNFSNNCAYCDKYIDTRSITIEYCFKCPIRIKNRNNSISCFNLNHPHNIWDNNETKENAQAVLDMIIKS